MATGGAINPVPAAADAHGSGIVAALKKYGDHAKAAYVRFSQSTDNRLQTADNGQGLRGLIERGSTGNATASLGSLEGLDGYAYAANIMAYPGRAGLFTVPTPIVDDGLVAPAAAESSWIGYIAEGTGPDGLPELVIAFRGSSINADWESNLLGAVLTEGLFGKSDGKVHRGFFNIINGTPDDAEEDTNPMKIIKAFLAPYKDAHIDKLPRIITTGHSLGGALAIVAAASIAHHIPGYRQAPPDYTSRKLQTYTFAAPRIGDDKLAAYLRDTMKYTAVQVKNGPDVVPYAPPSGLKELFSAVRKLIGTRPRPLPTAGGFAPAAAGDADFDEDVSANTDRWEIYKELLDGLDSAASEEQQVQQLQQDIEKARKEYETRGDFAPAASDNLFRRILYGGELLNTLATKWRNNPAPPNGVYTLDVHESGKWGGKYHSLEVYLKYLNSGIPS